MKGLGAKLVRYATVSVIATAVSLTVLGVLVGTSVVSAGWANVIATAVGTVPSFELNRRWVWHANGRRSMRAEIVPFAVLYMRQPIKLDSLWAGLCLLGAVYFMFRG